YFFFSSRRRHTRSKRDWSSDVCSSDLNAVLLLREHACDDPHRSLLARSRWYPGLDEAPRSEDSAVPSQPPVCAAGLNRFPRRLRSEERRVGKEWKYGRGDTE